MTAITLVDAIHDVKAIAQTFPPGAEEPVLRIGLNFARVVRKVPLQALALIRYLDVVTDDALQAGLIRTQPAISNSLPMVR